MIFTFGHRDGVRGPMSEGGMRGRCHQGKSDWFVTGLNNLREGVRLFELWRQWAREDGLLHKFDTAVVSPKDLEQIRKLIRELEPLVYALVNPRPPETPKWEATKRARVIKPFPPTYGRNPYHENELYQAGVGSVVEWPISVIKKLGDAVEPVPATTELCHVPVNMVPMA